MNPRLLWKHIDRNRQGAFPLRGGSLYLVVGKEGDLDRLHQEPESRDGLVVEELAPGQFQIRCCGQVQMKEADTAKLTAEQPVVVVCAEEQWQLQLSGVEVHDPLLGTKLGGHRLLSRLGNGSMGVVYRALQINLEREVALKVLDPKAVRISPLALASFKREAVAAGRLSHPNLVQVYDVGQDRGLYFYSMELVAGGDLEQRLQEFGPFPWREALGYLLDATEALQFAREHQLVHRDVKPENLMLTVDGRAKLADLGMATTRGMMEQESAGGTPHFMAPECIQDGGGDYRSDFYSLGCTLFRLLTAQTPFSGESVRDILRAHRDQAVPRLKEFDVDAPSGVQELVDWLMAKDPEERPQEAQEILDEIHDLLDGKHARGLIFGLSVLAVVGIGFSLFLALRPNPEAQTERVIVEVENPEAVKQRLRAAQLERELAFTTAMALAAGPERQAALEEFLLEYPNSNFEDKAQAELQRLRNLPKPEAEDASSDPFAAEREALAQLEEQIQPLFGERRYGVARQLLANSSIPKEALAPYWSRLGSLLAEDFSTWQQNHQQALAAEDWELARQIQNEVTTALSGCLEPPSEWQQMESGLRQDLQLAMHVAAVRDYQLVRQQLLSNMQQRVFPALEQWQFRDAAKAFAAATSACSHAQLADALEKRQPLFLQAAFLQEALFGRLDGKAHIPFTEPIDGKRAFATQADKEGLHLIVQVRGERVERVDSWNLYAQPRALDDLLQAVLEEPASADSYHAFQVLLAAKSLSSILASWTSPPSVLEAETALEKIQAWQQVLPAPLACEGALSEELLAIDDFARLAQAFAEQKEFEAFTLLHSLGQHFSLLGLWSSNGKATWGFLP